VGTGVVAIWKPSRGPSSVMRTARGRSLMGSSSRRVV
jgi:hypothetical protein